MACIILLWLTGFLPLQAQERDDYVYNETPLRTVIAEVEASSQFHFLYRDALVSGKTISLTADSSNVLEQLENVLAAHGLGMQVDAERRQILLFRQTEENPGHSTIRGYVVCAETGARLPFATISWEEAGQLHGRVANESGAFQLRVPKNEVAPSASRLTASYVGYHPREFSFGTGSPGEITIRLHPKLEARGEVVINSHLLDTELDTTWHDLIDPGLSAPFGQPSVLRALQPLPAVSLSSAFTDGLIVRGSRPDGFQVLLDGATIYNYSHFFGLFDVFNEEALQRVGFYYSVAPASLQAPPGGTLSFVTRPGSQTGLRQHLGASSTAVQGTAEGPIADGRGSWLLSGRHSYLDAFDWFNNHQIIAHGLGIERFTSFPMDIDVDPEHRVLLPGDGAARFYDLHGKVQYEWDDGRRVMANLYTGGDHTHQEALRLFVDDTQQRMILNAGFADAGAFDIPRHSLDTEKNWGNIAGSVHLQQPLDRGRHSRTILSASRYYSRYYKEDFVYTRYEAGSERAGHFIQPFDSRNQLLDLKLEQLIDAPLSDLGDWSIGFATNHYRVDYREDTATRPEFTKTQRSTQVDLFGQFDLTNLPHADLRAGLRSQYFSNGGFLRFSPRFNLRLFPDRPVALGVGYSKNHQFLHRLALEHSNTPNIWVMSNPSEPPGRVHQGTAGIYVKPSTSTFLQIEGYLKSYRHLRQHESVVQSDAFVQLASVRLEPWLHNNSAYARGLEFMLRQRVGPFLWTSSYALGRVDLFNTEQGNGQHFPANWDRRHQIQTQLKGTFGDRWSGHLTWMWTSGAPNNLAFTDHDEPERLPAYHRLDASLQWRPTVAGVDLEARMGLFNLYNQRNTTFRTPISILDPDASDLSLIFTNVDVYDLGFQPSFEIAVSF